MSVERALTEVFERTRSDEMKRLASSILQVDQYIGDVYSIGYNSANVIVHDYHRQNVGGIPSLGFLIATRINLDDTEIDYKLEDSSFILLRVMERASLPQDSEAERIRVETAQQVSGDTNLNWDENGSMDFRTRNLLSFAGVSCRIVGTFYYDLPPDNVDGNLQLRFGSDISNYYPNRGLKVYRPNSTALEQIVNYIDPATKLAHYKKYKSTAVVKLGTVRYASTNRKHQKIDEVPVYIYPADLLSQKTALFGMTRTGKSNTTKIIAKSIYELRKPKDHTSEPLRVGQIIFDPNGEYANENAQDHDTEGNADALKNIWKLNVGALKADEVITYGISEHPNDPDRQLMLLNFYELTNIQIGKEIINSYIAGEGAIYMKNFRQVQFNAPDPSDRSAQTRYKRHVLVYFTILQRAGFEQLSGHIYPPKGLFNKDLIESMNNSQSSNASDYAYAARIFTSENPTLPQYAIAFDSLNKFILDSTSGYEGFEADYVARKNGSGDRWADEDLKKLLAVFQYPNGTRLISAASEQHSPNTSDDYASDIYEHLRSGKLVIIDQSSGEPELNKSSADRIMWHIFHENQRAFRTGQIPSEILVYVEEAHNVLPAGSDIDLHDVWVRTAKEGAKYRLGLVYATQEVSSIQKNILKNTANWFIAHLNNTDETRELRKFYDFADFEQSILRAQDKGFLRVKTLSNLFVVPTQVDLFQLNNT